MNHAPRTSADELKRKRLVTLKTAAEHREVSVRTLRRWISNGTLPAHRFGPRMIRVDLDDVDHLLRRVPTVGGAA